jgi:hypothetical protein
LTRPQIWALLADKGFTREEIRNLDIVWTYEVLFMERDDKTGNFMFLTKIQSRRQHGAKAQQQSFEDRVRHILWLRGAKIHEIEELVQKELATHKKMMEEVYRKPGPVGV